MVIQSTAHSRTLALRCVGKPASMAPIPYLESALDTSCIEASVCSHRLFRYSGHRFPRTWLFLNPGWRQLRPGEWVPYTQRGDMQVLSDEAAVQWISEIGFGVDGTVPFARVQARSMDAKRLRIRIPDEATAVVGLAYMIAMTSVRDYTEEQFSGAILWLQRWELWSESIDRAGYVFLNGIRSSAGCSLPISSAPAHLFGSGELATAYTVLSLPMMFQWDAYFVSATGEFSARISHDGNLELISPSAELHRVLSERFQQWEPEEVWAN